MTFRENMRHSWETLKAHFRHGLHELGAALYGPGTVAQPPELGMIGTQTPGEVQDGRQSIDVEVRQESRQGLEERIRSAEATREPQRDAREMERD